MKRRALWGTLIIVVATCLFGACNGSVKKPTDISVNGKMISYYDDRSTVEKIMGEGNKIKEALGDVLNYDDKISLVYGESDEIRYIKINDSSVKTYKNISVGDKADKVMKAYKKELKYGHTYSVLLNGKKEIDPQITSKSDDWILINYYFTDSDGLIKWITIYDFGFGQKGK